VETNAVDCLGPNVDILCSMLFAKRQIEKDKENEAER
jgi:hypothetical protein